MIQSVYNWIHDFRNFSIVDYKASFVEFPRDFNNHFVAMPVDISTFMPTWKVR